MNYKELLQDLNVSLAPDGHHHTRDGWLNFDCPHCGSSGSGKYHMGLNTRAGYVNCWICGPHNLVETLVELTGKTFYQIKGQLKDVGYAPRTPREPHTGKLVLPAGLGSLLRPHRKYLKHRGFNVEQLGRLWNLQGIGLNPNGLQWRIFIPITLEGRTVSWTTRAIVDAGVRYLSAESSQEAYRHKDLLFGEDYCRHSIIVHEGPFDVFRIGPGATATCGVGYSRAQVQRISKYPLRVICFDNEPKAQARAHKLCDELEPFPGETINVVLDSKDAGSATNSEIKYLRSFLR